ncbi:uncharacterized protein EDB91DRAFT_1083702 [Suillus paluster]|uniref:uncharacterized protein n=1 Tax=Suillus paluster TaxID=48578 RepID=UPI001B86B4A7|nr:uncharacterized protein EDB91DRAFT_1083702 [Suillus paluster]KAG1735620.1 hypothetical protein EDB91DRAFT_1083702 [Suillus paluster]
MAHCGDCRILFSEDKKKKIQTMQDDNSSMQPSGKEKGRIHAIITREVFANDAHYSSQYAAYPNKFAVAVANHLALFTQTGGGVDPTDPNAAANLREDVLRQLPTYDDLDELWCSIPSYAPQAFSSDPKVDHSSLLLSIMHMKSAPASTSTAGSCPAPDDDEDPYDANANADELGGPDPSQDLPPTSIDHTQQLPQTVSSADDNDEYDTLDNSAMITEVNGGDSEMNADADEDYETAGYETAVPYENRVDKRPRPFSPLPPPDTIIPPTMSPHTPVSDLRASFTPHANCAFSCTSLSKPRRPPPSIASSIRSSSVQSRSSSGSVPTPSPTTNTSSSTKAKSVKHVRSDIANVRDKAQLLAQGVVSEHYAAKADQKMLKLQIHEKERDQMFSLSKQLIQQSSSSLDHQRTLESKNANIRLEQAKAQTHASEMELLRLKLQLGEQQLQLQQQQLQLQHKVAVAESSSHAS